MDQTLCIGRAALFISFEGGEGTGKTTQAELLFQHLAEAGHHALLFHEPGGTGLGEHLREWLKSEKPIAPLAELYLFAAARAELVFHQILPALRQGAVVLADRYADSTIAYQGCGRGLDLGHIRSLNLFATQNLVPDVTFLLDVTPEQALQRVGVFQLPLPLEETRGPDTDRAREGRRFEEEDLAFHQRVKDGYRELASTEPGRWVVLDGAAPRLELAEQIWAEVSSRLQTHHGQPDPRPEQPLIR